jgi:hypothetical protein
VLSTVIEPVNNSPPLPSTLDIISIDFKALLVGNVAIILDERGGSGNNV